MPHQVWSKIRESQCGLRGGQVNAALDRPTWTFLSNHGHVLICIAQAPDARARDIADRVGITERAAQRIISDLVESGYLTRNRVGRRNSYQIHPELPLRHPLESQHSIGELIDALAREPARPGE
jgi:predicted HTH transcriptional regulator